MAMAMTVRDFLSSNHVNYDVVTHPKEYSSSRTAEQSHLPGERLAKAVLIKGDTGYRLLVVPSNCKVDLGRISHQFRERLGLATEDEIQAIFVDCELGAIPPLGQAYGMRVCYDDALTNQPDLYLEAGDHETLVHINSSDFLRLMGNAEHGQFSCNG